MIPTQGLPNKTHTYLYCSNYDGLSTMAYFLEEGTSFSSYFFLFKIYFFWLHQVFVVARGNFSCNMHSLIVACRIKFPEEGSSPGPLHWECGPLGKFPVHISDVALLFSRNSPSYFCPTLWPAAAELSLPYGGQGTAVLDNWLCP